MSQRSNRHRKKKLPEAAITVLLSLLTTFELCICAGCSQDQIGHMQQSASVLQSVCRIYLQGIFPITLGGVFNQLLHAGIIPPQYAGLLHKHVISTAEAVNK